MFRAALTAAILVLGRATALAQNATVIKERQDNFKAMGDAAKPIGQMLKGEAEFALAAVLIVGGIPALGGKLP